MYDKNEYTKQAREFLTKASATCDIEYMGVAANPNWNEKEKRCYYNVTLITSRGKMIFTFWDSIHNTRILQMTVKEYSERKFNRYLQFINIMEQKQAITELQNKKKEATPTAYDILACLTKYDPGSFTEFCSNFGYDTDSIRAHKTYIACMEEYKQLERLFTNEQMEELREIN